MQEIFKTLSLKLSSSRTTVQVSMQFYYLLQNKYFLLVYDVHYHLVFQSEKEKFN